MTENPIDRTVDQSKLTIPDNARALPKATSLKLSEIDGDTSLYRSSCYFDMMSGLFAFMSKIFGTE